MRSKNFLVNSYRIVLGFSSFIILVAVLASALVFLNPRNNSHAKSIPDITVTIKPNHDNLANNAAQSAYTTTLTKLSPTPIPSKLTPTTPPQPAVVPTPNFTSENIKILTYHYIRDYVNPNDVLGERLSVSPANFEKQMQEITAKGYHSITFQDLINRIDNNIALPNKPIIISFDDGYDDHYLNADPILKKYNLKASFAIITGSVGKNGYMNWNQVKALKADGFEIVSHSVNHPDFSKASPQIVMNELKQSKATLDSILNQNTDVVVYPSGKFTEETKTYVKQSGYKLARALTSYSTITRDNLFDLPGFRVFNNTVIN